jgi:hypothetical protein
MTKNLGQNQILTLAENAGHLVIRKKRGFRMTTKPTASTVNGKDRAV